MPTKTFRYAGDNSFHEQPGSPTWSRGVVGTKSMTRTFRGQPAAFNAFLAAHPPGTVDSDFPDMTVQTVNVREWGPAYVTVDLSYTGIDATLTATFTPSAPKIEESASMFASATIYVPTNAEGFQDVTITYWRPVFVVSYNVVAGADISEASSTVGHAKAKNGADVRIISWTPVILNDGDTGPASIPPRRGAGDSDHYEVYVFGKVISARPLGNPQNPAYFKITESWEQIIITKGMAALMGFDAADKVAP